MVLGLALIGEHQAVAVDDPGGRRVQRRHAAQRRLHRFRFIGRQQAQITHSVGRRLRLDLVQCHDLLRRGGDNQLAAAAVGDAALLAVSVQQRPAFHTQECLRRAGRIVDAGVDDFAVARTGFGADRARRLKDNDLAAGERQRPCTGQADNSRTDYSAIYSFHFSGAAEGGPRIP
jgi:hypothetical protein